MLQDRLSEVESTIERALSRARRKREEVTLVAVTKTFPASVIDEAYALGLRHFGENYIQEFETKRPQLAGLPEANFHLIGHLQSNKSKKAVELFQTVETVDSVKLAARLRDHGVALDVMVEVKLSGEDSKHGADPASIPEVLETLRSAPNLNVLGLMTIPPWTEVGEQSRPYFAKLRELAELHGLRSLSMGMSNDFDVAIEEGATHVRVGTALFGSRTRP